MYLWRAVDSEGEVLDILVQSRRNKKAALKLMRKLLKKQGYAPNKVVTDKLPSYGAALRDLNMTGCSAPGSLDTSLSHAAGLIEIAACHA